MKTELTIEESAKLIELGVDSKLASIKGFVPIHPEVLKGNAEYAKPWGWMPKFTLTDLLAILPKMLIDKYGKNNPLGFEFDDDYMAWTAYYLGGGYVETQTELIDALFHLLCWVIENRSIDLKTNKK
ncbi:hypothetical protein [Clavibacter sp.]|uniref:hypothetical protein n=1 Tax=Clavibacter sp. TaxID=1871044 RepID=UPI00198E4186|nr:hypothetical protein [Clavibacter sp.]MBD5382007.1 hypothetical protein [Clavibacter sp.]